MGIGQPLLFHNIKWINKPLQEVPEFVIYAKEGTLP